VSSTSKYIAPHEPLPPLFLPDIHGRMKTRHGTAHTIVFWHWCPWHGGVYLCPDLLDPKHFYTPGCKNSWAFICSACAAAPSSDKE
jgi:hypothetical protein